jgi:3-oxoadipate enol-lactonase
MTAVHHIVTGRPGAPVVVLSNSLGTTAAMWDPNLAALEEHFQVVRYDTRGHGRSPVPAGPYDIDDLADDVVALLDRVGAERAHFVGLSLGGMTGLRLAARDPGRVDRLVVLCTSAYLPPPEAWTERAATVRAEGTCSVAEAVVGRWFTPDHLTPALRKESEEMVMATPREGYASCCEAIATMDLRDDLAAIRADTLAIAGADDPATPPEHLRRIAEGVRRGRLLVVPDAAHLANAQQPEVVTDAILEHLK